jgi:hypothetical protein
MLYLNPLTVSKEAWLREYGAPVTRATVRHFSFKYSLMYPVILICNGASNTALICRNKKDVASVITPEDKRPKMFYMCAGEDLRKVNSAI